MNNVTTARIYMIFALMLLVMGWKVCQNVAAQIENAQAQQAAQIERMLSSID